jgi:hypothetical protein
MILLIGLIEADGHDAVQDAVRGAAIGDLARLGPALARVNYLFFGRAATWPSLYLAGAVLDGGLSATGSGSRLVQALWSVAGEAAEAEMRAATGHADRPLTFGFGAHHDAALAAGHAMAEVVERYAVLEWWAGRRGLRQMDPAILTGTLTPPARDRDLHLWDLGAWPGGCVTLAASFDPNGKGFCFGAACRLRLDQAAGAAVCELVQAEFGLDLSRMKLDRFGADRLLDSDRLTLRQAAEVFLADLPRATATALPAVPLADVAASIRVASLGTTDVGLHVCMASTDYPAPGLYHPIQGPMADLPLYRMTP